MMLIVVYRVAVVLNVIQFDVDVMSAKLHQITDQKLNNFLRHSTH